MLNLLVLGNQVRTHLEESQTEWVETLASAMAEGITKDTINGNKLPVNELLINLTENDKSIEYAFVTDMNGKLFAHSFHGGIPRFIAEDIAKHRLLIDGQHENRVYNTRQGVIVEYDVPLIKGLAARLHLGLNSSEVTSVLGRVSQSLVSVIVLIGVLGFVLAWVLGRRISRPLVEFTDHLHKLAGADIADLPEIKTNDPDIRQMVTTFRSVISARDKAEKDALEREQNLSLTLDSIGDGVIVTDDIGQVTRMNAIAEQLTGWTLDEADGLHLEKVFPIINEPTRETIETPVTKVLSTGNAVTLANHTTLISKNGREYQIADSAAPIRDKYQNILGVILVFHDISEQYKLREEIRLSEQRLKLYHEQAPMASIEWNTDFQVLNWNMAAEKMFGYTVDEVRGRNFVDIMLPEKAIVDVNQIWKNLMAQTGGELSINENLTKEGKVILCEWHNTPLKDKSGKVIGAASIVQNITERSKLEEQLRRSQKMEALGKLTGGIAHDYNNLLGIILGYAEQLSNQLNHDKTLNKYAQAIQHAAERGASLTKKLLSFSRQKTFDATALDINTLLTEQQLMLEKTLTARIKLTYDLSNDLWPVELNIGELEDAIINLCINAHHAMLKGGKLTLRTGNQHFNAVDAQHLHLTAGDYVQLSISDTGSGMDETTKERIFDPFFTTKGERGTGLGLSQVYGFVERSDGAISVYSEPGHGSRFALYFPRSQQTPAERPAPTAVVHDRRGSESLLVVDDEQAMAELAYEILTAQGYRVFTANDGEQALTILEQKAKTNPIDLVISDVIMPNMDGYQLAAKIQERYPYIKIQIVSGFTDERHNATIDTTLHKKILQKPYTSKTLLTNVRNLLDENRAINHSKSNTKSPLAGRTIMVMDDEADVRDLFKINLERLGCNILEARDGDEAVTLYQQSLEEGQAIDVVIVDISIPGGLGGKEVSEKIRALNPHARLIVASGDSSSPEMAHYQDYGFDGALEKIFDREKIKWALEEVLSLS